MSNDRNTRYRFLIEKKLKIDYYVIGNIISAIAMLFAPWPATTDLAARTTLWQVAIFIGLRSLVTIGAVCVDVLRGTAEATEDVREVGSGVILVDAITIVTTVAFVEVFWCQQYTFLIDGSVDGKAVEGDANESGGHSFSNGEEAAWWLLVIVVPDAWI